MRLYSITTMFGKIILTSILAVIGCNLYSQEFKSVDAQELTVVGKLVPTVNPYHRLDTSRYPGMSDSEKRQAENCTGMAVAFRTDSRYIGIDVNYQSATIGDNSPQIATRGFDLYVKKDGEWLWAGNGMPEKKDAGILQRAALLRNAGDGWKECLVYLPLFSDLNELRIVTDADAEIELIDNPFKGRVAVFGSSYTHGSGCGRCAMSYCAQLGRMTGYDFINMGFSGNSKLQPYFAQALCDADVDAFLFDAFSNPSPDQMRERLFPFIEKIQKTHPGKPLIFMKSVWREKRNFDSSCNEYEAAKAHTADSLMRIAVSRYKDVYWIDSTNTIGEYHESTSDGSHPDNHGYTLWAESVRKPLDRILKKYISR